MIAFLRGKLAQIQQNIAIVDVNGVGYEAQVSMNTIMKLPQIGQDVMLYTHLSVREDGVSLIGFHSYEEKSMFLRLTTVSGIGPKGALTILSGIDLSTLALAIISQDVKALSKIKGVGKKTAERIVLELKESLSKESFDFDGLDDIVATSTNDNVKDAVNALCTLGISRSEAQKAVNVASKDCKTIEELIAKALKYLN